MPLDTVQSEIDAFQRFLNSVMPWGARLAEADEEFVEDNGRGAFHLLAQVAQVLNVGISAEGPYYLVSFGLPDQLGPNAPDEAEAPGGNLTVLVSDPVIDLRNGLFALELLDDNGGERTPRRFLLLGPNLTPNDLTIIGRGQT